MTSEKLLIHVVDIVGSYVASNVVAAKEVPDLINAVYKSLAGLQGTTPTVGAIEVPTPAMTIRASVKPDSVGCLECGKRFKSIKKHLATHDLTPDQYRARWSLPASYSMVTAEYSARRSGLATANGLGRSKGQK
ncbi:transcriptional regulatory protein MucR [Sphingomonas glacialis]|uniref:Transcriptional regulatory protein MucR n=1 Tax=Sphingomonas glacialis TaxID=658225 RepID=A0ABQ3LV29_9SPHN|nr:MucR family transcriptional regulator [Sphingomonas glacialis]GHH24899.1 transcriptional regulatory protein MucR [Sphingomonas glacialis]